MIKMVCYSVGSCERVFNVKNISQMWNVAKDQFFNVVNDPAQKIECFEIDGYDKEHIIKSLTLRKTSTGKYQMVNLIKDESDKEPRVRRPRTSFLKNENEEPSDPYADYDVSEDGFTITLKLEKLKEIANG